MKRKAVIGLDRGCKGYLLAAAFALGLAVPAAAEPLQTNPLNLTPPVRQAFTAFYNMEYGTALAQFQTIAARNPNNPIATDYVLYTTVVQELNRLDLLDTTFYANDGFLTGRHTVKENTAVTAEVQSLADRAVGQADAELARNPNDVNALFARAWARALLAAYTGLVQRAFPKALHLATLARADDAEVQKLDPRYIDADLVVGTYEYVIGALPFGFRLLIGIAGISGSKSKGMAMLEQAAGQGVLTSVDARTCMMLFLRREAKYGDAAKVADSLALQFPHNYLYQLELANLKKDGGHGPEAIEQYRQIVSEARKPGTFHNAHLELAYFGLGDTLRGQKQYPAAVQAFLDAAAQPTTSPELKQRCLVAAGMTEDLMHNRDRAIADYQAALAVGDDTDGGAAARRYLNHPYSEN